MFEPVRLRLPLSAKPSTALERADQTLRPLGFEFAERSESRRLYRGPSLNSTKENPLIGAGRLELQVEGGDLLVEADLSGTHKLMAFVIFFPPGLVLALSVLFLFVLDGFEPRDTLWHGIWLVLGPGMAWWIRRRSRERVERFARSLVV